MNKEEMREVFLRDHPQYSSLRPAQVQAMERKKARDEQRKHHLMLIAEMRRYGLTDREIGKHFGITGQGINNYRIRHLLK